MHPCRWRTDALFQRRFSGIGIMHLDATGPDALLPSIFYCDITFEHPLYISTPLNFFFWGDTQVKKFTPPPYVPC